MDVAVERVGDDTVLSHNALVSGRGTKFVEPDTMFNAEDAPRIAGKFTLFPLPTGPRSSPLGSEDPSAPKPPNRITIATTSDASGGNGTCRDATVPFGSDSLAARGNTRSVDGTDTRATYLSRCKKL